MKIVFFCKFPPPFTGQTIGTEVVYDILSDEKCIYKINTSYGRIKPEGVNLSYLSYFIGFSMHLIKNIIILKRKLVKEEVSTFYFIASPSTLGIIKNLAGVLVARPHVDNVVAHVRNGNYQEIFQDASSQYLATSLAARVDKFIFLSEDLRNRAAPYIPSGRCGIVRNAIDEAVRCRRDEVDLKIRERPNRDSFRVLFLSNMISTKGYMDVARALHLLRDGEEGTSLEVDFIGDWPDEHHREEFSQFVSAHGLQGIVRVHGRVSDRETIRQVYLDADAFVLPTYYPNEAQPRSIIEAMNAGTPIIATSHASIPEYVKDDHNGYIVSKKAPSEIAEAIQQLRERSNWRNKACAARETYEDMFSPSAVRESLLKTLTDTTRR